MASEQDNRTAIVCALRAGRSVSEITNFFGFHKSLVCRVKASYEAADDKTNFVPERKKAATRRSDSLRTQQFVEDLKEWIQEDPSRSMLEFAQATGVSKSTISRTVKEDLEMHSYARRRGQLLTPDMKERRKVKAAALLNELKHDSAGLLRFFSDEKHFDQDQKVNSRNDRWICKSIEEVPVVMKTKFPASVMVLGVISSEGDVMAPHFFEKGLRLNAETYIKVLKDVVKPWMDQVAAGRPYVFQQDSAPAHKARITQAWLIQNLPHHWSPDLWPPSSPDCNPLDYYLWGVVEKEVNKRPHNTLVSVKTAITDAMDSLCKEDVANACDSFRRRLQAVVNVDGGHFE